MPEKSIGVARMEADGTIVLQLRAEGPGGATGDALLRYAPGHPQYQEILRHLGGLEKGQSKPVPPWPEDPEGANRQVLADTFRNLVRYALRKTHRDAAKLGVTADGFSVKAMEDSLAREHVPSVKALLAHARQPSSTFRFRWKAAAAPEPLEAAFGLSYDRGDLRATLLWLALPERIPIWQGVIAEAVAELVRVQKDGRLVPYPPPR